MSQIPILVSVSLFLFIQTMKLSDKEINKAAIEEGTLDNENIKDQRILFHSIWLSYDIHSENVQMYLILLLICIVSNIISIRNCLVVLSFGK